MTNKNWPYVMIGAFIALDLMIALVLLITVGLHALVLGGLGILVGGILVFGISRLLMSAVTRRGYAAFREIARRQGGTVDKNILGEKQLRIPLNDSTIVVEYRSTGSANGSWEFWTLVGLEIPDDSLLSAGWQIDPSGEIFGEFPTEEIRQTAQKTGIKNLKTKVKIDRGTPNSLVSIWVPTYLEELDGIEQLLALSIPKLQRLISVWTSQIEDQSVSGKGCLAIAD